MRTRCKPPCSRTVIAAGALPFACLLLAIPTRAEEPSATVAAAATAAPDLDALLLGFASMPGFSARFREEKQLALLREPLVTRGALYFAPPDRLARHAEEPMASGLLLRGGELVVTSAQGSHTLDVNAHVLVRAFVDTFRLLLTGNAEALRELYRIDFEPTGDPAEAGWRIHLEPLRVPLSEVVVSLDLMGRSRTVREMRLREVGGDETLTRFSDVDTNRRFTESEIEALFRVP